MEIIHFGNYVLIEQNRFVRENEIYLYKVVGQLQSNAYVNVPVTGKAEEVLHDKIEDVVSCIQCGVSEDRVLKFRIKDLTPIKEDNLFFFKNKLINKIQESFDGEKLKKFLGAINKI